MVGEKEHRGEWSTLPQSRNGDKKRVHRRRMVAGEISA